MTLFAPKASIFKIFYFSFIIQFTHFNSEQEPFKLKHYNKTCFYNTLLNRTTVKFSKLALQKDGHFGKKKMGMLLQNALNLVPNVRSFSNFPILLSI